MRVLGSSVRMAILETRHQTDLEKRLQLLRRQVYGKQEFRVKDKLTTNYPPANATHSVAGGPTTNLLSDLSYLHKDLLKILIFASVAIGAQAILFFLLKNHLLNINFF